MQLQIDNEKRTEQKSETIKPSRKFYFDTSIWLDFLEDRNEPNLPKGKWAKELVRKIVRDNDKIFLSDVNYKELNGLGYSRYDLGELMLSIRKSIIPIYSTDKQIGKAQDLALKRMIPKSDVLQAFLARDNQAILITLDHHFKKIIDITTPHRPDEFI
jgi:predicted nucleic acid-binding protein